MTAKDIALGCKQFLEVERVVDREQVIDLLPVYHRKEERIRAHVILCWPALLLAGVARTPAALSSYYAAGPEQRYSLVPSQSELAG
jgi:hypothetical protein